MESISIPQKLEEWTEEKIYQILKYPGIESESLDFKKEPNNLDEHFCAMANTVGGFLILGIDEIKSDDGTTLLGYKIKPFKKGKEESINQQIRNAISLLEPTPRMKSNHMYFDDEFITIIEFKNEISRKPFMIKNTTQFWVRIKDSTRLANRSTIQMMFSASINQRNSIEKLKSTASLLQESFLHTLNDINSRYGYIAEVDLELFQSAVADSEWFLTENDLWGKHTTTGGYEVGINSILHDLRFLNTRINSFNKMNAPDVKESFGTNLKNSYNKGGSYHDNITEFTDKIINISNRFLEKMKY